MSPLGLGHWGSPFQGHELAAKGESREMLLVTQLGPPSLSPSLCLETGQQLQGDGLAKRPETPQPPARIAPGKGSGRRSRVLQKLSNAGEIASLKTSRGVSVSH